MKAVFPQLPQIVDMRASDTPTCHVGVDLRSVGRPFMFRSVRSRRVALKSNNPNSHFGIEPETCISHLSIHSEHIFSIRYDG